jgi:hypothetical protein
MTATVADITCGYGCRLGGDALVSIDTGRRVKRRRRLLADRPGS